MIKITFTCNKCKTEEDISEIDESKLEGKRITPVCESCYAIFLKKKKSLDNSMKNLHSAYDIPFFTLDD